MSTRDAGGYFRLGDILTRVIEIIQSKTEVVLTRKEARPRLRRKKDSGDGGPTTWEKKKRKTEAEKDGLCQPRHERYRNNGRLSP